MPRPSASAIYAFLRSESTGGLLLMIAAAAALVVANSPLGMGYFQALAAPLGPLSVSHWINDGLMAVFFLLVGLEIKREVLNGELSTWPKRALPGFAALGGMVIPAALYLLVAQQAPEIARGWAIPAATDIAFALGVLSLLGPRVPAALKVFLAALAIIDDLGAVLIIALFYTDHLAPWALGAAAAVLALLVALNRLKVTALTPYLLLGGLLWFFFLKSGVHATLAGVLLALTIPLSPADGARSPLRRLEHGLHPWTAYLIVPVFGFANAGVNLAGLDASVLLAPATLAAMLGLFLGKQIGVMGFSLAAISLGLARRPDGVSWRQFYGVASLCGVGFTMSLFLNNLAFAEPLLQEETKVGVLVGSVLSALLAWLVFTIAGAHRQGAGVERGMGPA